MAEFKDRLKELRKERRISQSDLAKAIDVSASSISMYEVGERTPELETFEALADFFNVDMNYLKGKSSVKNLSAELGYHIPLAVKRRVPVLGRISAGTPSTAEENLEGYEEVTDNDIDYALRVHGNSMVNARIHHGDIVFVTTDTDYSNGDIVIACVDGGDATIKRYYKYGDAIVLKPENPTMKEQEYPAKDVVLLGKVKSARIMF